MRRWSSSARARPPKRRYCSRRSLPRPSCRSISPAITRTERGRAAAALSRNAVLPVVADFARPFSLPENRRFAQARLLPRLDHRQFRAATATDLLRQFREQLGPGAPPHRHGPGQAGRAPARRLRRQAGGDRRVQLERARADQPRARWRRSDPRSSATKRAGTTSCRGLKCTWSRPAMSTSGIAGQKLPLRRRRVDPHREQP